MHKFGFRLESVLNLRTQLEENAKNFLGRATRELENQKEHLEILRNTSDDSISNFKSEANEGIPVYRMRDYNSYLSLLKNKIVNQKQNVNIAQHNVDINRESLVKAMQERKIIEKLKEKKYEEFLKERNKSEQLVIDELNSFKFKDSSGDENARD